MKILLTGHSGFFGSWLLKKLNEYEVIIFDHIKGNDITRWSHVKKLPKVDIVIHLAAITYIPYAKQNPLKTFSVNVGGTLNILEFCRQHRAKIIFPSTYVYGIPSRLPINESHPTHPNNIYAKSKLMAEELIRTYNFEYNLKYVILRFFNVYGPGQDSKFLIPKIAEHVKRRKIRLYDSRPKRDYIYIDDAIDAILKAIHYDKQDTFNIGSGKSISVNELVNLAINDKNIKVEYENIKRDCEILDCYADINKAVDLLKWKPRISMKEGLKRTIGAYL